MNGDVPKISSRGILTITLSSHWYLAIICNPASILAVTEAYSTHILVFDSLGTEHLKVQRILSKYLRAEAFFKKGLTDVGEPLTQDVQVQSLWFSLCTLNC